MKVKLFSLFFILLILFSCSENRPVLNREVASNFIVFIETLKIQDSEKEMGKYVFYLNPRECPCTKENLVFLDKLFSKVNSINFLLIVREVDEYHNPYAKEVDELYRNYHEKNNIFIYRDSMDTFNKNVEYYVTDKFFLVNDSKNINVVEFEKIFYNEIITSIDQG